MMVVISPLTDQSRRGNLASLVHQGTRGVKGTEVRATTTSSVLAIPMNLLAPSWRR